VSKWLPAGGDIGVSLCSHPNGYGSVSDNYRASYSTSPDLPSFVELDIDGDSTAEGSLNNKVLQVEFAITV
jgi:hypothetical protein